jgi:membrane-associated protein
MANAYGYLIYAILFLIIFVETGLVVMPFLPGDSLLFAAGAMCASTSGDPNATMKIWVMIPLLILAAVIGDNVNYAVGRSLGMRATNIRLFKRNLVKQKHLDKTHEFFERYGTKAIIMARFVPIVRTFTPFVAGVGKMNYGKKFLPFDIAGGVLWITSMSLAGYLLGNIPWVKEHFEMIVIGIILVSVLPMVIGFFTERAKKKRAAQK